jgi:outer membrane immunogenic protein
LDQIDFDVDVSVRGAQGIVSAGYDFQLSPRWVIGVFADYAFGKLDGNFGGEVDTIDNQLAIGSRLGLLASPSTLLHLSGGCTRADFQHLVGSNNITADAALDGYFVGIGMEQALTRNLALKLDYRFSDYEAAVNVDGDRFENDMHSVRLGVSCRFGQ